MWTADSTAVTADSTVYTADGAGPTPTPTPAPSGRSAGMGLRFGLGMSRGARRGGGTPTPTPTPAMLTPSADWDSTPGSGYTVTPTQTGTAPASGPMLRPEYGVMTDPAPVAQFINPAVTDTMFTEDLEVMIEAYAANDTDGIAGGIDHVKFYCEGNEATVSAPLLRSIECWDRNAPCLVYSVILPHADIASGAIEIYADIVPTNPALSTRTIGPLRVYRKTGYDKVIDIKPSGADVAGSVYTTEDKAIQWASNNFGTLAATAPGGHAHILCRYVEDATVTWTASGCLSLTKGNMSTFRGQVIVDGNGFDVLCKRTTWSALNVANAVGLNGLVLRRLKLDFTWISSFGTNIGSTSKIPIVDRCELVAGGRFELPGTYGPNISRQYRKAAITREASAILRSHIHDVYLHDWDAIVKVGNLVEDVSHDLTLLSQFRPGLSAYNELRRNDPAFLRTMNAQMQLAYAGSGTPKWGCVGSVSTSTRALVLYVDDVEVYRVTASATESSAGTTGIYSFAQAAADINANAANWTATLLIADLGPDDRRFCDVGQWSDAAGTKYLLTTPVGASWDIHGDFGQLSNNSGHDNHLISHNWGMDFDLQVFFPNISAANAVNNVAYVQNVAVLNFEAAPTSMQRSQLGGAFKHFLMVDNYVPNQALQFNAGAGTWDANCRVVNNVFEQLMQNLTATTQDAVVTRNHFYLGGTLAGPNVSGNTSGGTAEADTDAVAQVSPTRDNLAPIVASTVRANAFATQIAYDINGVSRGATAPAGAFA